MKDVKDQAETQEKTGEGVPGFQYNYGVPFYFVYKPGKGVSHRALARSARHIVMAAQVAEANITMAGCSPGHYLYQLVELHRRVEGTIRLMAEAFDVQEMVDRAAEEIRSDEAEDPEKLVDPENDDEGHGVSDALMLGVLAKIFGDKS